MKYDPDEWPDREWVANLVRNPMPARPHPEGCRSRSPIISPVDGDKLPSWERFICTECWEYVWPGNKRLIRMEPEDEATA